MGLLSRLRASPPWDEVVYWALDLETSGLRPRTDEILAVGMVPIRGGSICWGERFRSLARPRDPALLSSEGIKAHHILPGELEGAPPVEVLLDEIDRRLGGDVLLVHFAAIDLAFLERAHKAAGRRFSRPTVVDTVELLARLSQRDYFLSESPAEPITRLDEARRHLALPPHRAHDALSDALATAELFLALRSRLHAKRLSDLR